jgi:hypothetical protein
MFNYLGIDRRGKRVTITYPYETFSHIWAENLDPFYPIFRLNPLFEEFLLFDDNYILFRGQTVEQNVTTFTHFVLAYRIND